MASASPATSSTKETTNYARLCRLLVDVGTFVLRDCFDAMYTAPSLHTFLAASQPTLQSLRSSRIINAIQWGKLFPVVPSSVASTDFDITLLMILLRNICGLAPPVTGWDALPAATDVSREADIARVKYFRNTVYAHAEYASVDDATFDTHWKEIRDTLVRLGGVTYEVAIDNLKFCSMDPITEHHYEELLHQWKNDEDNIKDELKEVATDVKEFGTVIKGVGTDVKEIGTDVKYLTKKLEDFVTSTVTPVREINDKKMSDSTTVDETIAVSRNNPPEIDFTKLPAGKLLEKQDLPKKSKRWEEVKLPVDALLLTVKDCEFLSCVSYLNSGFFRSNHITLGDVYFGEIGDGTKVALKVCEMGSSGPGGSAVAVQNAVKVLKPKVVFSVGFCGGLNERKLKLGDVVVLTKLMAYGTAKVTESKTEYRGVRVVLDKDFLSMVQSTADGWTAPLTTTDDGKSVTVHRGPFLTGSQVVDSQKRRDELTEEFPDALAIEMEAEGLYQAAHDLKIEWGVIKGVSDFANGRKSNTDSWRPFASVMAASLTAHILDDPVIFQDWKNFESRSRGKKAEAQ